MSIVGQAEVVVRAVGGTFGKDLTKEIKDGTAEGEKEAEASGKRIASALAKGGAAIAGIGFALTKQGETATLAQNRLERAITNSGKSAESYRDKVDAAIDSQTKYGVGANEVRDALTKLTLKLKDPEKALASLGLITDAAKAKNISFAAATDLVAKATSGNAKVLAQFGINVKDSKKALDEKAKATEAAAASEDKLKDATQKLDDLQRVQASHIKLSLGEEARLRDAKAKVLEAEAKSASTTGTAHEKAIEAEKQARQKLADLEATFAGKTKLSVEQEIALRDARQAVVDQTTAVEEAHARVAKATDGAKDAIKSNDDAVGLLRKQVQGFADDQANTLTGKLAEIRTKISNVTEELGQRFGPAIAVTGTALGTGAGLAGQITSVTDLMDSRLGTSLTNSKKKFEDFTGSGTAAGAAAGAAAKGAGILGAVVAGGLLALELNKLNKEHDEGRDDWLGDAANQAFHLAENFQIATLKAGVLFERLGGAIFDDVIAPIERFLKVPTVARFLDFLFGVRKPETGSFFAGFTGKSNDFVSIVPGKASGGPVIGGRAVVVGERGPELFIPNQSGTVIPNGAATQVIINASFGPGTNAEDFWREMENIAEGRVQAFAQKVTSGRLAGVGTR